MSEEKLRLVKLVEHWIEHNDEHGNRFSEEAEKAENMGLKKAADEMRKAAEASKEVTSTLKKALKLLEESG
jgi:hypothetical protein